MSVFFSVKIERLQLTCIVSNQQAKDGDIELNGQLSYALATDSIFTINNQTGEIKSKMPLDYEKDRVYLFYMIPFL